MLDNIVKYIALPSAKAAIWNYFGFITKDGKTVYSDRKTERVVSFVKFRVAKK